MRDDEKTRARFNHIMNTFAMVYGQATSVEKNRVYFNLMQEFPIEVLENAAKRLLDKKKISTFPTIAEWKDCCWQPEELVHDDALAAWVQLDDHLVALTVPENPKTLKAVERVWGTWAKFKAADRHRDHWDKLDFVAAYKRVHREHEEAQLEEGMTKAELEAARKRLGPAREDA